MNSLVTFLLADSVDTVNRKFDDPVRSHIRERLGYA
jgi:hypothetical protein